MEMLRSRPRLPEHASIVIGRDFRDIKLPQPRRLHSSWLCWRCFVSGWWWWKRLLASGPRRRVSRRNAKGPGPSGAEKAGAWRDTPATTTHRVNLQANPFPLVNHATAQGREILSHAFLPSIILDR